jgi:transcriptional regulator with XRE-family HTH domain
MTERNPELSLGERLRLARLKHNHGLRQFARKLEIAPSYLADIENDRRTPTERLLATMAPELGLDFDELMALSGRMGEETTRYVRQVPAAARLFRRVAERNLDEQAIKRLEDTIDSGG